MDRVSKSIVAKSETSVTLRKIVKSVIDGVVLAAIIALSAIAMLAVALITPLVLTISALGGLFASNGQTREWRPAGA